MKIFFSKSGYFRRALVQSIYKNRLNALLETSTTLLTILIMQHNTLISFLRFLAAKILHFFSFQSLCCCSLYLCSTSIREFPATVNAPTIVLYHALSQDSLRLSFLKIPPLEVQPTAEADQFITI